MFLASDFEGAIALTSEMIPKAERAGSWVGVALMRMWRGASRVQRGDPAGIADMEMAAEALARRSHFRTSVAYNNLGDTMLGLGDLSGAYAASSKGATWAERVGRKSAVVVFAANLARLAYVRGDWREAGRQIASVRSTHRRGELHIAVVDRRIALARGERDRGGAVAAEAVAEGAAGTDDEFLYSGLALQALGFRSAGEPERAAAAAGRFLERWRATGGLVSMSQELAEVSVVLAAQARDDFAAAARTLPDASTWKAPLLALAGRRYGDAAAGFEAMEAMTLATEAHLLAAAAGEPGPHAQAVLEFADARGALLYRELLDGSEGRELRDARA